MLPEVTFVPAHKAIRIRPGTTVMDAGSKTRVHIRSRCGGKAQCLMCKVIIEDQRGVRPMEADEENKLGHLAENSYRLACQTRVIGDVTVRVPDDPLKEAIRMQLAKQREEEEL
ncbi:MAG TPA: 2Fe-2S iron-sulfur cluster-binding protein [Bacilli bacterium]